MRLSRGCPLTPPAVTEGGRQSGSVPESGITSERMTEPASQALVGKYTGGKEKGGGGGNEPTKKTTKKTTNPHDSSYISHAFLSFLPIFISL